MDGELLLRGSRDLGRYLRSFHDLLGRMENRQLFEAFVRGQLSPIERKSLEPIADAHDLPARSLQRFFSRSNWDEEGVRRKLQQKVARRYGSDQGVFIVDETSDAKKGEWTAGIQRQYCGESGKIDNCIVSVHLAYAQGDFRCLLDGELFLPESWNPDPKDPVVQGKRRRAMIPDDVGHVPKTELALGQVGRALENGVPGKFLTADEGYGDKPKWRQAVGGLGLTYVVEVSGKNVQGWSCLPDAVVPKGKRPGRERCPRPASAARPLGELRTASGGLRFRRRVPLKVKDTHKGPEVWKFKEAPFWQSRGVRRTTIADGFSYPEERLLVGVNARTNEVKYFLTNDLVSPMEGLVAVAFTRWSIERCFQDCKQELGLNHAEIRNYRGLHRHFTLVAVTYYFVQDFVQKHQALKRGA